MAGKLERLKTYIRVHGVQYTLRRSAEKIGERCFGTYERIWQANRADEAVLAEQRANQPDAGLLSLVIPVFNTDPPLLTALLDSITAQTYARWEAVLCNAGTRPETADVLMEAAAQDPRFRVLQVENQGIAGNTNLAIEAAQGTWVVLCDHDDLLTPDALWQLADRIVTEAPDVIYTDEDKVTESGRIHTDAHPKPDFCPDNLRSSNYICHLLAAKKQLVMQVGGLRSAFDGSQDHDLALRLSEATSRISHIPVITYHWRSLAGSMSHQKLEKCFDAACRAVEEHTARIGFPCHVAAENGVLRLRYEIQQDWNLSVITNGSWQPDWPDCEVIQVPAWTYAELNRAAAKASGDMLLLINQHVKPASPDFIKELLMYAQRPDVGAVIPVLTDERDHITHAGYAVTTEGKALCRNPGLKYTAGGWHLLAMQSHNVAAVAPACAMIRKSAFIPFREHYEGSDGSVDWSLRLQQLGLRHVYTPHAHAVCTDRHVLQADPADAGKLAASWTGYRDPCYPAACNQQNIHFAIQRRK